MCNKQNLPARVEKANAAMFFSSIMQYTKDGKPKAFVIPGSNAKQYQVILRRVQSNNGNTAMTVEVNLLIGNMGIKPLRTVTVSYHGMCAVQIAAQEAGYKVVWCANEADAKRLANINGRKFSVSQWKNPTAKMWGVMREE